MVACCPSHADSSSMRAGRGAASASNTSTGSRPCSRTNTATCRVRPLMTLDGRYSPPGAAARTASHSAVVRLDGSAGQVATTAAVRSARHFAERAVRPAVSWAVRTIRSLTRIPSAGPTVQPSLRRAIHAFDGSLRPMASSPEASTSTSIAFQWAARSESAMPDTRSTHLPTRSASVAVSRSSPVFSSTPVRRSPRAQAVREVSPAASGTFRPTPTLPCRPCALIRSTTLIAKGHPLESRTHLRQPQHEHHGLNTHDHFGCVRNYVSLLTASRREWGTGK